MQTPERFTARLLSLTPAEAGPIPPSALHTYCVRIDKEPDPTHYADLPSYPCDCLVVATADGATPDLAVHAVVNKVLLDPRTAWMARHLLRDGGFGFGLSPALRG